MLTIFCWLFYLFFPFYWMQYKNTPPSQLTSEVQVTHKASTEADLGTQCITVWCLSKSVHVLSMECYDWICYRFPNFKKKLFSFQSCLCKGSRDQNWQVISNPCLFSHSPCAFLSYWESTSDNLLFSGTVQQQSAQQALCLLQIVEIYT